MSKGLEELRNPYCASYNKDGEVKYYYTKEQYKTIEKELKERKQLLKENLVLSIKEKALEIIKEKKVNVGDFVRCKSVEDYNEYCCYGKEETLTQKEYDLLIEVLL